MTNNNPLRWQQRFNNFENAIGRLNRACTQQSYSELERAGLIQTFEFTFELAWKTLKDYLEYEGFEVASPRSVIRTSLTAGVITSEQCEALLEALNKRNLLTHTYDEETALQAVTLICKQYQPLMLDLYQQFRQRMSDE